jgi:hypothetical protein
MLTKEKLREIVNTELSVEYLIMMYPEMIKDIEDSLVEALHQALSMSGVSESWLDSKWNEYRLLTNNEDAWCFKEWLKSHVR